MRTRAVAVSIAAALAWGAAAPPARAHGTVRIVADASAAPVAATNPNLIGVGWDRAGFTADAMRPVRPNLVRIDAGFEHLYPSGPQIDEAAYAALAHEVSRALSIEGAEPVVILSYMPAWLASVYPPWDPRDATKAPPRDPAQWKALVSEVVQRLAALGVRWFEVWNEPDWPVFYQGSLTDFLERIYRPSAEAVAAAGAAAGTALRFGGCACLFPDPVWIVSTMTFARANGLPMDFVSWHYYGNYPMIGPDGQEPLGPPEQRQALAVLGQRNPAAAPTSFADQIEAVRGWRDAVFLDLGGSASSPELIVDEWNLSAGGFDLRHDAHAGAAFDVATLVEMQRAGLDRSAFFRSVDPAYGQDVVPAEPELYGGWGLVGRRGTPKPALEAFTWWGRLGGDVLAFASSQDARQGLSAVVTRGTGGRYAILAAGFQAAAAHGHAVTVALEGVEPGEVRVTVTPLGGTPRERVVTSAGALEITFDVAPSGVVLVETAPAGG